MKTLAMDFTNKDNGIVTITSEGITLINIYCRESVININMNKVRGLQLQFLL